MLSIIWIFAPGSSGPFAISFLLTVIFVFASRTMISVLPYTSAVLEPVTETFPVLSSVKVISAVTVYPVGATVSRSVYTSPTSNPSMAWAFSFSSVLEIHSSTTLFWLSITWIFAPGSSSPVAMSFLVTVIRVSASSIRI